MRVRLRLRPSPAIDRHYEQIRDSGRRSGSRLAALAIESLVRAAAPESPTEPTPDPERRQG